MDKLLMKTILAQIKCIVSSNLLFSPNLCDSIDIDIKA